mgnify:CR=1 FL=1
MRERNRLFGWAGTGVVLLFVLSLSYPWLIRLAFAACTNTSNMTLCKPSIAQSGWGTNLNNNFDTIDTHDHTSGKGVVIVTKTTGEVFHTTAASCPAGSAEYTTARGFYIVGLPSGGTSATSVGTALTNLENRAAGQHLHSVDPPSTSATVTDSGHTHDTSIKDYVLDVLSASSGNLDVLGNSTQSIASDTNTTGITASVNIAPFDSANGGSVVGTNAPYIHLLVCRQS